MYHKFLSSPFRWLVNQEYGFSGHVGNYMNSVTETATLTGIVLDIMQPSHHQAWMTAGRGLQDPRFRYHLPSRRHQPTQQPTRPLGFHATPVLTGSQRLYNVLQSGWPRVYERSFFRFFGRCITGSPQLKSSLVLE